LSPRDFVDQYHYLSVPLPIGRTTVHVYNYFMKSKEDPTEFERRKKAIGAVKDKTEASWMVVPRAVFQRVWEGKGSPDDISAVLQCAVETGCVPPETKALQAFADENIGIDCSGFVCAYLRSLNLIGTEQNVLSLIEGFREDSNAIAPLDVLEWYTKDLISRSKAGVVGHVAIVDTPPFPSADALGDFLVCESRGGGVGISKSRYSIRKLHNNKKGETIFEVDCNIRGYAKSKECQKEYVKIIPSYRVS
jgi:hypothetical protein